MKFKIKLLLIFCAVGFMSHSVLAQMNDAEGSKDHVLVPRLENFYIANYKENRFDFENFKTNDSAVRVEGHKLVIDYRLQPGLSPKGKNFIFESFQKSLDSPETAFMLNGPYYLVFKITNTNSETWVKVDPVNSDGNRYTVTIVEKEKMSQEISAEVTPSITKNPNDIEGSNDYSLLSRMPDFYIGRFEETEQASEIFKTSNGNINTEGHKIYIDYYLEHGKVPPGKIQILENYKTSLLNSGAEILLDGAYYDVYKVQNSSGETLIKIDPGNYDGKRYEITIVETIKTLRIDSPSIELKELEIVQETGKPLLKRNDIQRSHQKIYTYSSPQKVKIQTSISNSSSSTINKLIIEFKINGEGIKNLELPALEPGKEEEIECEYDLPDMDSYNVEVNVYEETSPHILANVEGLLQGSNNSSDLTGFVYPDFEIRNIAYLTNPDRIAIEIQNNGAPHEQTSLLLKTWISNPYRNRSDTYETSVDAELGPGERKWYNLIEPFSWPNVVDNPTLNFTVLVDADQKITEIDEGNNSMFKQVCIPCGVQINEISNPWVYKFKNEDRANQIFNTIYIYGEFGYQRTSKQVVFKEKSGELFYIPQLNNDIWDPLIWDDFSLEVNVSSLSVGEYQVFVNCSSPTIDFPIPFSSNAIDFKIRKRPDKPFNFGKWARIVLTDPLDPGHYQLLKEIAIKDGTLDARKLANALFEEFGQNLSYPSYDITIWTRQDNSNIILHSEIDGEYFLFEKILFEVWHIEPYYRLDFSEITFTDDSKALQHSVTNLQPGLYEFKARFIYSGGKEISKSIIFRVNVF